MSETPKVRSDRAHDLIEKYLGDMGLYLGHHYNLQQRTPYRREDAGEGVYILYTYYQLALMLYNAPAYKLRLQDEDMLNILALCAPDNYRVEEGLASRLVSPRQQNVYFNFEP